MSGCVGLTLPQEWQGNLHAHASEGLLMRTHAEHILSCVFQLEGLRKI